MAKKKTLPTEQQLILMASNSLNKQVMVLVKQRTAGTITSEDEAELDRLTKQELPIMRERLGEVLIKIMDTTTEKTSVGIFSAD